MAACQAYPVVANWAIPGIPGLWTCLRRLRAELHLANTRRSLLSSIQGAGARQDQCDLPGDLSCVSLRVVTSQDTGHRATKRPSRVSPGQRRTVSGVSPSPSQPWSATPQPTRKDD